MTWYEEHLEVDPDDPNNKYPRLYGLRVPQWFDGLAALSRNQMLQTGAEYATFRAFIEQRDSELYQAMMQFKDVKNTDGLGDLVDALYARWEDWSDEWLHTRDSNGNPSPPIHYIQVFHADHHGDGTVAIHERLSVFKVIQTGEPVTSAPRPPKKRNRDDDDDDFDPNEGKKRSSDRKRQRDDDEEKSNSKGKQNRSALSMARAATDGSSSINNSNNNNNTARQARAIAYKLASLQIFQDSIRAGIDSPSLKQYVVGPGDETMLWLGECASITSIDVTASRPSTDILLSAIQLKANIANQTTGDKFSLAFTSNTAAFQAQFGTATPAAAGDVGFLLGYNCFLFALDAASADAKGPSSIESLARYIGFRIPTVVDNLLSGIEISLSTPVPEDTKSPPPRNGLWHKPYQYTGVRLQCDVDLSQTTGAFALLRTKLQDKGFDIQSIFVIGKRSVHPMGTGRLLKKKSSLFLKMRADLTLVRGKAAVTVDLILGLTTDSFHLMIEFPKEEEHLDLLPQWLAAHTDLPQEAANTMSSAVKSISEHVLLRKVALGVTVSDQGGWSISDIGVDFELPLPFGESTVVVDNATITQRPILFISFMSNPGVATRLVGKLWNQPGHLLPYETNFERENFLELSPATENASDFISLPNLSTPALTGYPTGIPDEITEAEIDIDFSATPSILLLCKAQCGAQPKLESGSVPTLWLDSISLEVGYLFGGKDGPSDFTLDIAATLEVKTRQDLADQFGAITVQLEISHDPEWVLSATATNIKLGNLYCLFDHGHNDAVMNIMSKLTIPSFSMSYMFGGGGLASSFALQGSLIVGPVELDLGYTHSGDTWAFHASLEPAPGSMDEISALGLLADLMGDEEAKELPPFIAKLNFHSSELKVTLDCFKPASSPEHVVFGLHATVGDFTLSYVQLQDIRVLTKDPDAKPTRMVRFALTGLPKFDGVPIVNEMEQPFDQLDFIWLNAGLTREEVDILNNSVFSSQSGSKDTLIFKDTTAQGKQTPTDILGAAGLHFMVILNESSGPSVVIDHIFGGASASGNEQGDPEGGEKPNENPGDPSKAMGDANTPAPVQRSFGSLSVRNIGIQYKERLLHVSLDASVRLGPVGFALLGFGLSLDFSNVERVKDFKDIRPVISLDGMSLEYNEPPTVIAGMLKKITGGFSGGIIIAVEPYNFMAAGAYQEVLDPRTTETYKSVFIFAKLNGPLIELEFAEISGITGGFGYNSYLRLPDVTEIVSFPFIQPGTGQGQADPMTVLSSIQSSTPSGPGWVTPQNGAIWLAAGLEIKAFQSIAIQAVAAFELSSGTPKLAIVADAFAVVPEDSPRQFLFVELGIVAVLEPTKGILSVDGQLTPRSFVLDPSCHLTGGFGLHYWFKGSQYEGDWVFTVGGYHRAYLRPSHYPNPPRVGISWSYDSNLSITGGAYFAITPKMAMGGGRLDVIFKKGDLGASLTAFADFLINYRPFEFTGEIGVEAEAYCKLGLGKLKKKVTKSVSVDVKLWGPPVAGTAHVKVLCFSFTVHFGPSKLPTVPLTISEMWDLLLQKKNDTDAAPKYDHVVAVTSGLVQPANGATPAVDVPQDGKLTVRSGTLAIEVHSRFPLSKAICIGSTRTETTNSNPIYCKPMHVSSVITSELTLTCTLNDDQGSMASPNAAPRFAIRPLTKQVPTALWGAYRAGDDPTTGSSSLLSSSSGGSLVLHVMGLSITPEEAALPSRNGSTVPPFDVSAWSTENVLSPGDAPAPLARHEVASGVFQRSTGTNSGEREHVTLEQSMERVKGVLESAQAREKRSRALGTYANILKVKDVNAAERYGKLGAAVPRAYLSQWHKYVRAAPVLGVS